MCVLMRPSTCQAPFNDHANSREEGPPALQDEPRVFGIGMRICTCALPFCEHTLGLPSRPRDARLAQAHVLAAHHGAPSKGDRDAMRKSERATAERRRAVEHRLLLGLL